MENLQAVIYRIEVLHKSFAASKISKAISSLENFNSVKNRKSSWALIYHFSIRKFSNQSLAKIQEFPFKIWTSKFEVQIIPVSRLVDWNY